MLHSHEKVTTHFTSLKYHKNRGTAAIPPYCFILMKKRLPTLSDDLFSQRNIHIVINSNSSKSNNRYDNSSRSDEFGLDITNK